jgi:hypothetical protein
MSKRKAFLIALALVVALAAAPAFAQGKGKGGGSGQGKGKPAHVGMEKDKGASSHHQAGDNEPGPNQRPAGWDKGKKEGWSDCNVPPGLAKKRGCDAHGLSARERSIKRRRDLAEARAKARTKAHGKAAGDLKTPASTGTRLPQASSTSATTKTTTRTTARDVTRSGGETNTKVRPVRE